MSVGGLNLKFLHAIEIEAEQIDRERSATPSSRPRPQLGKAVFKSHVGEA
jgi:hypothetical protein